MLGVVGRVSARVGGWFSSRVGEPVSSAAGGRLAATLFVLCGSLLSVATALPVHRGTDIRALLLVGLSAIGWGLALWRMPWARWRRSASLYAVVPPALLLIAWHNGATNFDGYRYSSFFLVLFAWVGLAHPSGTALRLSPFLAIAYVAPMIGETSATVDAAALSSLAYAVPVAVLVGETAAWVAGRLRSSEAARSAGEARWRSLVTSGSDVVLVISADGRVQYASPSVERVFGYTEVEAAGFQVLELIHPDDIAFVVERLGRSLERPGKGEHIEFRALRADGVYMWVESIGTNLLDNPSVGGIVCNIRDITERKEAERVLVHRARHDALTGLPNRSELADLVSRRIADRSAFALLLLDLDRFREINDALGHETGDRVLVDVAHRLARSGAVVARLGGDEFAVIADGVADARAAGLAAIEIRATLDDPFEFDGMALDVVASIGIALHDPSTHSELDATPLLQHADVAMYRAKAAGAGWAVFGAEDEQNRPARLAMVSDLRAAIDADEIRAHYQPQLSLSTGQVEQVEVLARWTRAGVSIPPDVFIPLAEHTGLIGRLTHAMLHQALQQCRRWADVGMPLKVAVNVSALSLRHGSFVDEVRSALAETGVPAHLLTLELTESAFADETETVVAIMHELRELGVRLSIDDFGSGYSSMAYLKRLPIDELKIDKAFVVEMLTDRRDQPITRAIIELAHSLGLNVVGEGVESPALERLLREFDCDAAQGYGICRPIPAEELTSWLRDHVAIPDRRLRPVTAIVR